ncbi:MAG TPA: inositol monophosphatase [Acidimicrobiales bacterium]|nr:inositol monophosphatase [Acidimicrobiales bacterium]
MAEAIREVAAEVIEPRFHRLMDGEVREKSPGEVVTVVDEQAETALARRLSALIPAPVVGEEACAREPDLLSAIRAEESWLVDPLDGTANFIAGSPDWAVMVALLRAGRPIASWIWRPCDGVLYQAERGSGCQRNGESLAAPGGRAPDGGLRGAVLTRFLDPAARARLEASRERIGEVTAGAMCAGVDYPLVAEGGQDFVCFRRTLPWDHAPGSLLVEEAGGSVGRLDGRPYEAWDLEGHGLLAARSAEVWEAAATWLR